MKPNLEQTRDIVAFYLAEHCTYLPLDPAKYYVFTLQELAERTGTTVQMLGKIRMHFTHSLAQAMTRGRNPLFEITAQGFYGRAAIAVKRIRNDEPAIAKATST